MEVFSTRKQELLASVSDTAICYYQAIVHEIIKQAILEKESATIH